jgi:hypothetical protein
MRTAGGAADKLNCIERRERAGQVVPDAEAVLRPDEKLGLKPLVRTFSQRTGEGVVESFGPGRSAGVGREAPGAVAQGAAPGGVSERAAEAGGAPGPVILMSHCLRSPSAVPQTKLRPSL